MVSTRRLKGACANMLVSKMLIVENLSADEHRSRPPGLLVCKRSEQAQLASPTVPSTYLPFKRRVSNVHPQYCCESIQEHPEVDYSNIVIWAPLGLQCRSSGVCGASLPELPILWSQVSLIPVL